MNVHEYQAKKILEQCGINVPKGSVVYTPSEAKRVAQNVSTDGPWMVKAQIHAGARETGHFLEHSAGKKGGIRKVTKITNIAYESGQMLNNTLVTEQTEAGGCQVNKVYIEAFQQVKRYFYAAMVIDCTVPAVTLLISDIINQDILRMANEEIRRDKIMHVYLRFGHEIQDNDIMDILQFLSLDKSYFSVMKEFTEKLYHAFMTLDARMIEVNPVGVVDNKKLVALDAKIDFDDNALFRHPDIVRMRDDFAVDGRTAQARRFGFQYKEYEGNIGCIINGEGLALEVIDILHDKGYNTACTLNIKGSVDKDRIAAGIKIIMTNPKVEGVLINILGGFLRCNLIAEGIITATQEVGLNMPIIVRMEGTNREDAYNILNKANLPVVFAQDTNEAATLLIAQMEENE